MPAPALLSRPGSRGQAHRWAGSGVGRNRPCASGPAPSHTRACTVPHSSPSPLPALSFSSQATVFVVYPTRLKIPDLTSLSEVLKRPLPSPPQMKQPSPGTMCRKRQRDSFFLTPGPKPYRCPQQVLASSPHGGRLQRPLPSTSPRTCPAAKACLCTLIPARSQEQ